MAWRQECCAALGQQAQGDDRWTLCAELPGCSAGFVQADPEVFQRDDVEHGLVLAAWDPFDIGGVHSVESDKGADGRRHFEPKHDELRVEVLTWIILAPDHFHR